eukprot:gene10967-12129_t
MSDSEDKKVDNETEEIIVDTMKLLEVDENEDEVEDYDDDHRQRSFSLQNKIDMLLSDANVKANDAAMNLKQKLRSFSPSKRKSTSSVEGNDKVKRSNSKKKRLAQMVSGASFKSKCVLFKRIFKDLPLEESLIIDYSCALQRDILVHGRVYLSQNWMCFYANIFGWETTVTINWHEITAITKEKTARVIPNAIRLSTSSEKCFFTSFVSRDSAYTALFRIWQNALLDQAVSPLELRKLCRSFRKREIDIDGDPIDKDVDETGDEITENDQENQSISASEDVSVDNLLDRADDDESNQPCGTKVSVIPPTPPPLGQKNIWSAQPDVSRSEDERENYKEAIRGDISDASSRASSPLLKRAENLFAFARKKKKLKKKSSNNLKIHSLLPSPSPVQTEEESSDESESGDVLCPCVGAHSGTEYIVEEYDFDVDALFEHLFSPDSDVMKKIHESRKMLNCKYHEAKQNDDGSSTRLVTYKLTLNYTIGPKHSDTDCYETFSKDNTPGSFYVIHTKVYNKGIPYADSFHILSQFCLTKLAGNRCKMRIHSEVVYLKPVFFAAKNMLQRNADQGFRDYFKNLAQLLTEKSEAIPVTTKKRIRQPLKSRDDIPVVRNKSDKSLQSKGVEKVSDYKLEKTSSLHTSYSSYSLISHVNGSKLIQAFSVLLIILLGMNSYLMYRIYKLERFALTENQHCVAKNLPVTDESWYNLLQTQRQSHEFELKRLKDVIGGTAKLVKQVEVSIYDLYKELEDNAKTKPPVQNKEQHFHKKVITSAK